MMVWSLPEGPLTSTRPLLCCGALQGEGLYVRRLHIPPILPTHVIQRMTDLPQRVVLHRLDQLLEHIAPIPRRALQHLETI